MSHIFNRICDTKSTNLTNHSCIHTGEKAFICKDCGKGFITSNELTRHSRIYTGEKTFICKDCGKGFSRSDSLTRHPHIHNKKLTWHSKLTLINHHYPLIQYLSIVIYYIIFIYYIKHFYNLIEYGSMLTLSELEDFLQMIVVMYKPSCRRD